MDHPLHMQVAFDIAHARSYADEILVSRYAPAAIPSL